MKKALCAAVAGCLMCCTMVCYAAEDKLETPDNMGDLLSALDAAVAPEPSPAPSFVVEMPADPLPVIVQEPEETFAIDMPVGGVYPGSFNSSAINVFAGIMARNFGQKYVCYKSDRYTYVMYYGNELKVDGSSFSGKGKTVEYRTGEDFPLRFGNGLLSVDNPNAIIYTNLSKDYPELPGMEGIFYASFIAFMLVVFLGFSVLRLILFRS